MRYRVEEAPANIDESPRRLDALSVNEDSRT